VQFSTTQITHGSLLTQLSVQVGHGVVQPLVVVVVLVPVVVVVLVVVVQGFAVVVVAP